MIYWPAVILFLKKDFELFYRMDTRFFKFNDNFCCILPVEIALFWTIGC